jgi:hypothetical protein
VFIASPLVEIEFIMNIFSRVLNAIAPALPATTSATPTSTATIGTVTSHGYRIGEPAQDLDGFEQTYSRPPYLNGSYLAGVFYGRLEVAVSTKTVKAVAKRAGNLLTTEEKNELEQNRAAEKILHERMGALGFLATTTIWQQRQAEAAQKIKAGDQNVTIPTRQQTLEQICGERAAIHVLFREYSARNYVILKLACDRFGKIARAFVSERDQQERAAHADLHGEGVPFKPSDYLRALCFIAMALTENPTRNFSLCGNLPAPDTDKLMDLFIPPYLVDANAINQPSPAVEVRAQAEPSPAKVDAAAATRNRADLEQKNLMVEKIKADIQQASADKELAGVKAAIDREARNAALKQKILDDEAAKKANPVT